MNKRGHLDEATYQKNVKIIKRLSFIILLIGILIGGSIILLGITKQRSVKIEYSEENKEMIRQKIETEKKTLEAKKIELEKQRNNALATEKKNLESHKAKLEDKGIKHKILAKYSDGEVYDLYIVTNALDPSFNYCAFEEYKKHNLTSKYCTLSNSTDDDSKTLAVINKVLESSTTHCLFDEYRNNPVTRDFCSLNQELDDMNNEFNKEFDSKKSVPFYMFGSFIIIATCMISGFVYIISKRREIAAFTTQQLQPITQEHIENIGTTIGKAVANAAKEINPEYKSFKCPNCGASIEGNSDIEKCAYCGEILIKTGRLK